MGDVFREIIPLEFEYEGEIFKVIVSPPISTFFGF
jgi:hypothetical protein